MNYIRHQSIFVLRIMFISILGISLSMAQSLTREKAKSILTKALSKNANEYLYIREGIVNTDTSFIALGHNDDKYYPVTNYSGYSIPWMQIYILSHFDTLKYLDIENIEKYEDYPTHRRGVYKITMTKKAKKVFQKYAKPIFNMNNWYSLLIRQKRINQVTGISLNGGKNIAEVEMIVETISHPILKYIGDRLFGYSIGLKFETLNQTKPITAKLKLYDDGWRLMK